VGKWLFLAEFLIGTALIAVFFAGLGQPELAGLDQTQLFDLLSYALLVWWGLYVLIAIFSVVESVRWVRRDDLVALRRSMLLVKLSSVPFFVLNFVLASAIAVASRLIGTVVVVPITYLLMVLTSAYGIGCLTVLRRRGLLKGWVVGLAVAAQLVFVLDVISSVAVAVVSSAPRTTSRG
jgi:hypothetical protein